MKKFLSLAIAATLFMGSMASCTWLNDLEVRQEKLEDETITSINEQIANIKSSIAALQDVDKSIKAKIAELEAADKGFSNEIANLKKADEALGKRIDELKNYVDNQLASTKDWASATFSTLAQYKTTCDELAAIKRTLDGMGAVIDAAIKKSEDSIKNWVNQKLLSEYYTISQCDALISGLQKQLDDLKNGQKKNADNIDNLSKDFSQKIKDILNNISELQSGLSNALKAISTAKTEITAAYTDAISKAIKNYDGSLSPLKAEVAAATANIATIQTLVSTLQTSLTALTTRVAAIESMVQSIVFVPEYEGNVAVATWSGKPENPTFQDFVLEYEVTPSATAAKDIVDAYSADKKSVSLDYKTVKAITKSGSLTNIAIKSVQYMTGTDVITVTVAGSVIKGVATTNNLIDGKKAIAVRLKVKTGNTEVISDFTDVYTMQVE